MRNLISHLTLDSHYSITVTEEVRYDKKQTKYPTKNSNVLPRWLETTLKVNRARTEYLIYITIRLLKRMYAT